MSPVPERWVALGVGALQVSSRTPVREPHHVAAIVLAPVLADLRERVEAMLAKARADIERNAYYHYGHLDPASVPPDAEAAEYILTRVLRLLDGASDE